MKKLTILALDQALSSSIFGPMDIFCQAGLTWNYIFEKPAAPFFEVKIVTPKGTPVTAFNGATIQPHCAAEEITSTDLILISSFASYDTLTHANWATDWLRTHYNRGATIGSICIGTFLLASTGLLNGKTATTHWGFIDPFRKRFPEVLLRPDKMITDEGNLLCSGACNSYIDLSLYLIERFCGPEVALECSKTLLHDLGRSSQAPYIVRHFRKDHNDLEILAAQSSLEHCTAHCDVKRLAREHGMSRRSFERRFKTATGHSPLFYLQLLKVEKAKWLLESSHQSFGEISWQLGYEDSSFFRKIFKKNTGLLPLEYRSKFRRG
jgi:transcriptional regulator GlxA family with amidase domain